MAWLHRTTRGVLHELLVLGAYILHEQPGWVWVGVQQQQQEHDE